MALQHQTLPETAAKAVLDIIIAEGLDEGDALPSSADLAERFSVSSVVIREALAILAARGVVSRRQGREPIVAKPGSEILTDLWRLRAHHDDITVDEFMQCRLALELQTAALVAVRRDLGRLRELVAEMRAAGSPEKLTRCDFAFHMELARLSGNRVIEVVLASLHEVVHEVFTIGIDQVHATLGRRAPESIADLHARVVDEIESGDPARASAAMSAHFAYSVPGALVPRRLDAGEPPKA